MRKFRKKALGIVLAAALAAGTLGVGAPEGAVSKVQAAENSGSSDGSQFGPQNGGGKPPAKPGESSGQDSSNGSQTGSGAPGQGGPGAGGGEEVTSWDAENEFNSDTETTGESYDSTGTDENTIHVSGGSVVLNQPEITRKSSDSDSSDTASFYGVGAALLTTDGTSYVNGGTISTDADGGAGIFSYGEGTTYVKGATIHTRQDKSGGIHVAGGGKLYAYGLNVTTEGGSSAAIRSDRGGGTMVVDGGSYTSNGSGSPAIYSTADITVNKADLTANGSEGICIEGLNTVRLYDSSLTSNMPDDSQNDTTWSVIVYQSMSGDSEEGNGTFSMVGGSLTSRNGGLFYTTNTESTFYLKNVKIMASDDSEFFLRATGNSNQRGWGSAGSNGADTNFTAEDQEMEGDVIYDSISNLNFYMKGSSTLTGGFLDDESCAGDGGNGAANLYISSGSTWVVTKDSTLTGLYNEGTVEDADGKQVKIVGTDGTVYQEGDSDLTVTVDTCSREAEFTDADSLPSADFSAYAVPEPYQLAETVASTTSASLTEASSTDSEAEVASVTDVPESAKGSDSDTASVTDPAGKSSGWKTGLIAVVVALAAAVIGFIAGKRKSGRKHVDGRDES